MHLAPRKTALTILMDVDRCRVTLDRRMDDFHRASRFDRRDEAFVTALVYGVLRWRRRLDRIIGMIASRPLTKIDRNAINIIRLGLYQMLFMDRVPNSAAINTSVDLVKTLPQKWLAGFVNAVLRNALRRLPEIETAPSPMDSARALAITQSMPDWLVNRWIDQFGLSEATSLCETCNDIPSLTLRTNTLRIHRTALLKELQARAETVRPARYAPDGIIVDGLQRSLFTSPAFKKGWFQVQDEAAQAVAYLLAPNPGQTVLDACAGLGGKTAHIAALMNNSGRIDAMDHDGRKLEQLAAEMQRLGIDTVSAHKIDLLAAPARNLSGRFDRILLDAPCSGLGVIRRNPDTKWTRTTADIDRCARRQLRLLDNVAPLLKPGGALVFAVCSTEPEETHAVVDSFLNKRTDFAIDEHFQALPHSLTLLLHGPGRLATFPHRHGMDGFFAVRLCHRK